MNIINFFVEFFLHIDTHLSILIRDFGPNNTYLILCLFIVIPFFPGDSLLFALGALAAAGGGLKVEFLLLFIGLATISGDSTIYWIGYFLGSKIQNTKSRLIKKEHLDRTHRFYEKYGGKTIILAKFIPIIRTFAPFVAGIGKMRYRYFIIYNLTGNILWVVICILGGYFFGNLPFIKHNFSIVMVAIVLISVVPAALEYTHQRRQRNSVFTKKGQPLSK